MDFMALFVPAVAVFIASFFATVAGFGFGLIATPLLALVMPIKAAIICTLIVTVMLRAITMYNVRSSFSWRVVLTTFLGSVIGTVPGSYVLRIISLAQLEIFLSTVLLLATFFMGRQYRLEIKNKTLGRLTAGLLSGFFGASTSVSGPPLVLYFLNEESDKVVMRANMVWIFGLAGTAIVISAYLAGNIGFVTDWNVFIPMIPAMFVGIYLGEKFFRRLNQHLFRRLALIAVCAGAVMMLINGLREVL